MTRLPRETTSTEVVNMPDAATDLVPAPLRRNPFFNFSYSVTEWRSQGGVTRVDSRRTSFVDGRLRTERFEGEMEGGVVERMAQQMQRTVLAQAELMMRSMSWFLPAPRRQSPDDAD